MPKMKSINFKRIVTSKNI